MGSFGGLRDAGEYRAAAGYYLLDGFVTEHVTLLQDCGLLYKHLAVYEADSHRKCVLHKRRTGPLEKVLQSLNPKVYSAFFKEITFMLGECYRAILELKKQARRPHVKVRPPRFTARESRLVCIRGRSFFVCVKTLKNTRRSLLSIRAPRSVVVYRIRPALVVALPGTSRKTF
jgi:hypothetical protein